MSDHKNARELFDKATRRRMLSDSEVDRVVGGAAIVDPAEATGYFGGMCLVVGSGDGVRYLISPIAFDENFATHVDVDYDTFRNYYLSMRQLYPDQESVGFDHSIGAPLFQ